MISEDFSDNQGCVGTYSTYFLPSFELALRVFCILEVSFIFGVLEKIQEYGRPCAGESVVMGDDEGV